MKNIITTLSFAGLLIAYFVLLSNSTGALAAFTGAPAEQTCGIANCHNTMTNQGSAIVSLDFDGGTTNFEFGATYPVQITITDAMNIDRNGFEIVALDNDNNNLGSWSNLGNDISQKSGANSRSYLTHTLGGSAQTEWSFEWKAPDSGSTDVTFYLAALDANNNSNKGGDDLYTLSKTIMGPLSSIAEAPANVAFIVAPNPVSSIVNIYTQSNTRAVQKLSLMDSQGKQVLQAQHTTSLEMGHLNAGIYFLIIQDDQGKRSSKKLLKI